VDAHPILTIEATAMEALAVLVGDSRAPLAACLRILHGAGTTTLTRHRMEDTAVAHLHRNAGHKVDVWACRADRACVDHVLIAFSTAQRSCVLVVTG
jgi:hypothetical protein